MKRKLILWLMGTKSYRWSLKNLIPYVRFSMYYAKIKGNQYKSGYKLLKSGDIILTTDKKKLTSLLIPGEWNHAALCIDKGLNVDYEVAEMTHADYTKSHFFDICKESDRILIMRCPDFTDTYIKAMTSQCKEYEKAKYDVEFNLGIEALYCSELIYQSDFARVLNFDLSDFAGIGRPYLSPQGIRECKNLDVVWDSEWL